MAAITITTGISATTRNRAPRSAPRRLPTTAPGRRPSVATGRSLERGSATGRPLGARPVAAPRIRPANRPLSWAVYWRRRLFVAALVVGLVLVMAQAGAALGGSSLATPGRSPSASASAVRHTVVRAGDSLWSVAGRLAPGSDLRPVVDSLSEARHGAPLVPGETVEWGG